MTTSGSLKTEYGPFTAKTRRELFWWDLSKALLLLSVLTPMITESATKRKLPKDVGEAALWTGMYWSSLIPGFNYLSGGALWTYEFKAGKKVDSHNPPGMEFMTNGAQLFLDGLNAWGGRHGNPDWYVDALETLGTIPTNNSLGGFSPRQAITFIKGLLDLKSGKSQTGWSLIDRGAMYEGRPVEPRHHGKRW